MTPQIRTQNLYLVDPPSFAVRCSQGECLISAIELLGTFANTFNEVSMSRDKYGSKEEGNRTRVYVMTFTIAEAKGLEAKP